MLRNKSYAYAAECYGKQVVRYTEDDVTMSVPKLFFGYAMGANLFFPFTLLFFPLVLLHALRRSAIIPVSSFQREHRS